MKTYSNFAGKEEIPYLPENWHKNLAERAYIDIAAANNVGPYRIWLESPPYSKTAMILLDQKNNLKGGGG